MRLPMGVEHPVKTALRADIERTVRKDRHDLSRRQRGEFRLVAGEQDPLAFLVAEAVSHMAMAAFTAIGAVPITCELPPPALQRAQAHAQQLGQLTGSGTVGKALIENLQGLPAIVRGRQSSPSSPQKAWIFFAANSSAAASARAFSLRRSSCLSCLISRWSC